MLATCGAAGSGLFHTDAGPYGTNDAGHGCPFTNDVLDAIGGVGVALGDGVGVGVDAAGGPLDPSAALDDPLAALTGPGTAEDPDPPPQPARAIATIAGNQRKSADAPVVPIPIGYRQSLARSRVARFAGRLALSA